MLFVSCGEKSATVTEGTSTDAAVSVTEAFESARDETVAVSEAQTETDLTAEMPEQSFSTKGYVSNGKDFIRMRLHTVMQEEIGMPFGCEAVSLAIALDYYGFEVDPETLFLEHMAKGRRGVANPFYAYVGDPRDRTGYGCYAPCAVRCANSYLESVGSALRARDISGATMDEIKAYLWEGKPVVLWGTLNMEHSSVLEVWRFGGNPVYWYNLSHCVVLSGTYSDRFFVCDPMEGSVSYLQSDVERSYKQIYTQALVIE